MKIALLLAAVVFGADLFQEPSSVHSLYGISRVPVIIGGVGAEAQADGLTLPFLQEECEKRLALGGVPSEGDGEPFLFVWVDARLVNGKTQYAYTVVAELRQRVAIPRSKVSGVLAATWSKSASGMAPRDDVRRVKTAVAALVDDFVAAYRSANPR